MGLRRLLPRPNADAALPCRRRAGARDAWTRPRARQRFGPRRTRTDRLVLRATRARAHGGRAVERSQSPCPRPPSGTAGTRPSPSRRTPRRGRDEAEHLGWRGRRRQGPELRAEIGVQRTALTAAAEQLADIKTRLAAQVAPRLSDRRLDLARTQSRVLSRSAPERQPPGLDLGL